MIFFRRKKTISPGNQPLELPPLPDIEEPITPSIPPKFPEKIQKDSIKPSYTQTAIPPLPKENREEIPPYITEIKMPEPKVVFEGKEKPKESLRKDFEKQETKKLGSLFIPSNKYKELISNIEEIEKRLRESRDLVTNLNEIKNEKDKEFERWRNQLEDIQKKLLSIDKTLSR